jgi:hypothetical protein
LPYNRRQSDRLRAEPQFLRLDFDRKLFFGGKIRSVWQALGSEAWR